MKLWMLSFTLLPIIGNIYALWRIWHLLPFGPLWSWVAVALLAVPTLLFFGAFALPLDRMFFPVAAAIYEIGTSWLFILIYLVMILLAADLLRIVHLLPSRLTNHSAAGSTALLVAMVVIFVLANIQYNKKVKQPLQLTMKTAVNVAEKAQSPRKILMIADLHLGYTNRRAEFQRWVNIINAEQPDLVLIGGDIIDGSIRAIREQQMEQLFHQINAPIYACLGNHEYLSGPREAKQFYRDAGIHLLCDERADIGDITIIGRDDRSNPRRASLEQLTEGISRDRFTILLDHQPYNLEKAEAAGINFQFSGHTHYGQVWPINWIEDRLYECAFGQHQRGATRYYVTSGLGQWGGKFRIGTRSEYVVATLE